MREIKNCNVCVIGGAGFIGSHLVNHLIEDRNCKVLVLDNLITGKKEFINPKATFEYCDITHSESQLRKLFEVYKIEYVFNYSAEPYIPVSFARPLHVFDINARGALMVLNAAQSAEIYGDAPDHKIDETYPANPHSSYGASKLAIDVLIQCAWKERKTPAIAMRQFNCLGEHETHQYVVPEIIKQLSESNTIRLGNNSYRDFQYAGDAVRMAVELLEKGQFGEVYNMGSENGIKIYDLAHTIGRLMGKEITIEVDETRFRPWEIWHLQSDNTKLYNTITYRPKVTLDEALLKVIKDYNEHGFCFN